MRRDELYLVASGIAPVVQQLSSESCMRVNAPRMLVDGGKCIAHGSTVVVGVAGVRGMMVGDLQKGCGARRQTCKRMPACCAPPHERTQRSKSMMLLSAECTSEEAENGHSARGWRSSSVIVSGRGRARTLDVRTGPGSGAQNAPEFLRGPALTPPRRAQAARFCSRPRCV